MPFVLKSLLPGPINRLSKYKRIHAKLLRHGANGAQAHQEAQQASERGNPHPGKRNVNTAPISASGEATAPSTPTVHVTINLQMPSLLRNAPGFRSQAKAA